MNILFWSIYLYLQFYLYGAATIHHSLENLSVTLGATQQYSIVVPLYLAQLQLQYDFKSLRLDSPQDPLQMQPSPFFFF